MAPAGRASDKPGFAGPGSAVRSPEPGSPGKPQTRTVAREGFFWFSVDVLPLRGFLEIYGGGYRVCNRPRSWYLYS